MTIKKYLAESPRGTLVRLAAQIDAPASDVCMWAKGRKPVPPHRAVAIELATNGTVTVEASCPTVSWVRVPDVNWPTAKGKPLLDLLASEGR
jgi:DNA-binding transcriptional regulator YdaS (Cro superfamily)